MEMSVTSENLAKIRDVFQICEKSQPVHMSDMTPISIDSVVVNVVKSDSPSVPMSESTTERPTAASPSF